VDTLDQSKRNTVQTEEKLDPYLKALHFAIKELRVETYLDPAGYLLDIYHKCQELQPSFTYEKFSIILGLGKNNVSFLLCHQKRTLTPNAAQKIGTHLGLDKLRKRYFVNLAIKQKKGDLNQKLEAHQELVEIRKKLLPRGLDKEQLAFYSSWRHSLLFELTALDDFKMDIPWISKMVHFRLSAKEIKESLDLLQSLNLIRFDVNKHRFVPTKNFMTSGPYVTDIGIVQYHQEFLDLAKQAIEVIPQEERDITSLTLAVNKDLADKITMELAELRRKLIKWSVELPQKECVYQLNLQLFPLTKKQTESNQTQLETTKNEFEKTNID
jgi:uncharacterized protein (TIGR02147 family)